MPLWRALTARRKDRIAAGERVILGMKTNGFMIRCDGAEQPRSLVFKVARYRRPRGYLLPQNGQGLLLPQYR